MKAPKCRLCEAHHWNNEAHKFKQDELGAGRKVNNVGHEEPRDKETAGSDKPRSVVQGNGLEEDRIAGGRIDGGVVQMAGRTPNRRSREDYNAYMKTYMRKRRESKSVLLRKKMQDGND